MEYDDEVFARIEGYDFDYAISNYGRILNINTKRFLKPGVRNDGYMQVGFVKNKKTVARLVHRLLGNAFLKNDSNRPLIDHIDRNKLNNSLSNLRWADYQVNSANTTKRKNTTSKYKGINYDKARNKWRCQICINYQRIFLGRFDTENEAVLFVNDYIIKNNLTDIFPLNDII